MNSSPSGILQTWLIAQGFFTAPSSNADWPLFDTFLPDGFDDAGVVIDLEPSLDGRLMKGGEIVYHKRVMLILRCVKYTPGWVKMCQIMDALSALTNESIVKDSYTYALKSVMNETGVVYKGLEENSTKRRRAFSMNLSLCLNQA